MSDPFAPSAICQRDVISLRPTMKVISQSEGISREPRLLQRPGKLGPVTLFMLEVRQTASSRRQLKWLMIPFPPPSNLNTYNPRGPADMFLSTLTICKSPRKKGEGGGNQKQILQIRLCESVAHCRHCQQNFSLQVQSQVTGGKKKCWYCTCCLCPPFCDFFFFLVPFQCAYV